MAISGLHGYLGFNKRKGVVSHVHKFGSSSDISAVGGVSIWSGNTLYPWSALANAETLYVSSTVAGDNGDLEIQGLGADWEPLTETVSLNGDPSQVTTQNTFRRVFRMRYSDTNAGLITARTVSHAGTIVSRIEIEKAQTLMAVYTIPDGYIGYLMCYTAGVGKNDNADIELFMRDNPNGAFRVKSQMSLFNSVQQQEFAVPLELQPKTDIDFRASGQSASSLCTLNFDLLLYKWNR